MKAKQPGKLKDGARCKVVRGTHGANTAPSATSTPAKLVT